MKTICSFKRSMSRGYQVGALAVFVIGSIGCGPGVEIGTVSGVVTRGGEPLDQVMVYFMPDPKQGTHGRHSTAVTDAQGRYTLTYFGDPQVSGAVIGLHRVTLEDLVPENYRGPDRPPKSRVPEAINDAWKSPLVFKVKSGDQQYDIAVPE